MFKRDFDNSHEIDIILKKIMNILTQKLNGIWQKAICTRPYTLHLAISTKMIFCTYYNRVQGFLDTLYGLNSKGLTTSNFLLFSQYVSTNVDAINLYDVKMLPNKRN